MRNVIRLACAALLAGILGFGMLRSCRAKLAEKELGLAVGEINQALPRMINQHTRINSVTATAERTIRYDLTVVDAAIDRIDRAKLDGSLRPRLIDGLKNKPEFRVLSDLGVTIVLRYKDMNGAFIAEYRITPQEYRN